MNEEPFFLTLEEVLELHSDQLRLFGGADGLRNPGALESAIAMPRAPLSTELFFTKSGRT